MARFVRGGELLTGPLGKKEGVFRKGKGKGEMKLPKGTEASAQKRLFDNLKGLMEPAMREKKEGPFSREELRSRPVPKRKGGCHLPGKRGTRIKEKGKGALKSSPPEHLWEKEEKRTIGKAGMSGRKGGGWAGMCYFRGWEKRKRDAFSKKRASKEKGFFRKGRKGKGVRGGEVKGIFPWSEEGRIDTKLFIVWRDGGFTGTLSGGVVTCTFPLTRKRGGPLSLEKFLGRRNRSKRQSS